MEEEKIEGEKVDNKRRSGGRKRRRERRLVWR